MIVYSKTKLLPTMTNYITLTRGNDTGFFYVSQDVYDSCVILKNRYPDAKRLEEEIIVNTEANINTEAKDFLLDNLPKPLDSLASLVCLVTAKLDDDIELLTGVLSVITSFGNVLRLIETDKFNRKNLLYSGSIMEEYQMSWMMFKTMAIPYEQLEELLKPAEIHPKVEQQPVIPVYMMNGFNNMQMQPQESPKQEGPVLSDDGNSIILDEDDEDDFDIDEFYKEYEKENGEEPESREVEEPVKATTSTTSTTSTPMSDVAGFNAQEDKDKAMELLGAKNVLVAE